MSLSIQSLSPASSVQERRILLEEGYDCVKKGFLAEAVVWFTEAAEEGDAIGQCEVGLAYLNGWGVKANTEKAVRWFELAAEQNDEIAQRELGRLLIDGNGVAKDEERAFELFCKAMAGGDELARCFMGLSLFLGKGVAKDEALGKEEIKLAAEKGVAEAQYSWGEILQEEGKTEEGALWIRQAAAAGYEKAQKRLSLPAEG